MGMSAADDYPVLTRHVESDGDGSILAQACVAILAEVDALRDLAEFARHDEGCNGPDGYRCRCRYVEFRAAYDDLSKP